MSLADQTRRDQIQGTSMKTPGSADAVISHIARHCPHAVRCRPCQCLGILATLLSPCAFAEPEAAATALAKVEIVGIAPLYGLGIDRELLPYPVQVATDVTIRKSGGENLSEF